MSEVNLYLLCDKNSDYKEIVWTDDVDQIRSLCFGPKATMVESGKKIPCDETRLKDKCTITKIERKDYCIRKKSTTRGIIDIEYKNKSYTLSKNLARSIEQHRNWLFDKIAKILKRTES